MNVDEQHLDAYLKVYASLGFERAGLFAAVQKQYGCITALYPGSSVHITPSFSIPHVVYVDRQAEAAEFFARTDVIRAYVERRKSYRRTAYLQFIAADFTQALPLEEASFDLLIALFAGEAASACARYVRKGGQVLTHASAEEADRLCAQGCRLSALIRFQRGSYHIQPAEANPRLPSRTTTSPRYLQREGDKLVYHEEQVYQIFTRA